MMKLKDLILFFTLSLLSGSITSQSVNYLFSSDSLAGFDENIAKQEAFSNGCFGNEFKVFMNRAKRSFVNAKYNVRQSLPISPTQVNNKILGNCLNDDFETSSTGTITTQNQIAGWTINSGSNLTPGGSCNLTASNFTQAPNAAQLLSNGFIDPSIGSQYPIFSVFGANLNLGDTVGLNAPIGQMFGNNFIKLNDNFPNFGVHVLSKTILVTPANALFKFAFINAFWTAHACCDASAFLINFKNLTTGTASVCPNFSFAPGPVCVITSPMTYYVGGSTTISTTNTGLVYNPWQIRNIDLTPFMGNTIQIDFIITDCVYGAHQAIAYLDAECGPMPVLASAPGNPPICLPVGGTATISAAAGFAPYKWNGPGSFTSTAQTITVSVPGNYTLTLGDPCLPSTYIVTVTATPNLTVTPFSYICNGSTVLTANGAATYTWNPGNLNGNSISVSPTVTTNYTVVGANGTCTNSAISTVSVGVAPPLVVGTNSLTGCKGTCFTFTNSSAAFNPFTYDWGDGTALSPTTATHCYSVAGIYSITAQATYSSGCSVISSGVLTVTILPAPIPGIGIAGGNSQLINLPVTFNNLSTGGNSFIWNFADSSAALNISSLNNVIHTYTATGNYCVKLIAIDTIQGCKDSTNKCLDILCVSHINFPNVFTPNGDDVNEVFTFENDCIKSLNCVIYDRWGLYIYNWETVHGVWDGHTVSGEPLSEGIYFFIMKYVDSDDKEITKTGCISLVR